MKKQSYTIQYSFSLSTQKTPSPELLRADIEIDGEPHGYSVEYTKRSQKFSPISGTPCALAVGAAVKRLTDWKKMWEDSPKKVVKILHKNCRLGDENYEVEFHTEISWEGFTWSTVNSTFFMTGNGDGADTNTECVEIEVEIPTNATVTYPGKDDAFSMEDLGNLFRGIM